MLQLKGEVEQDKVLNIACTSYNFFQVVRVKKQDFS